MEDCYQCDGEWGWDLEAWEWEYITVGNAPLENQFYPLVMWAITISILILYVTYIIYFCLCEDDVEDQESLELDCDISSPLIVSDEELPETQRKSKTTNTLTNGESSMEADIIAGLLKPCDIKVQNDSPKETEVQADMQESLQKIEVVQEKEGNVKKDRLEQPEQELYPQTQVQAGVDAQINSQLIQVDMNKQARADGQVDLSETPLKPVDSEIELVQQEDMNVKKERKDIENNTKKQEKKSGQRGTNKHVSNNLRHEMRREHESKAGAASENKMHKHTHVQKGSHVDKSNHPSEEMKGTSKPENRSNQHEETNIGCSEIVLEGSGTRNTEIQQKNYSGAEPAETLTQHANRRTQSEEKGNQYKDIAEKETPDSESMTPHRPRPQATNQDTENKHVKKVIDYINIGTQHSKTGLQHTDVGTNADTGTQYANMRDTEKKAEQKKKLIDMEKHVPMTSTTTTMKARKREIKKMTKMARKREITMMTETSTKNERSTHTKIKQRKNSKTDEEAETQSELWTMTEMISENTIKRSSWTETKKLRHKINSEFENLWDVDKEMVKECVENSPLCTSISSTSSSSPSFLIFSSSFSTCSISHSASSTHQTEPTVVSQSQTSVSAKNQDFHCQCQCKCQCQESRMPSNTWSSSTSPSSSLSSCYSLSSSPLPTDYSNQSSSTDPTAISSYKHKMDKSDIKHIESNHMHQDEVNIKEHDLLVTATVTDFQGEGEISKGYATITNESILPAASLGGLDQSKAQFDTYSHGKHESLKAPECISCSVCNGTVLSCQYGVVQQGTIARGNKTQSVDKTSPVNQTLPFSLSSSSSSSPSSLTSSSLSPSSASSQLFSSSCASSFCDYVYKRKCTDMRKRYCCLCEQPRAPTPPLSQSENHKQYKLPISMISEDQRHQCNKAVCSLCEQPRAPTPPLSQSENHKQYKLPIISMISEDQIHQCNKAVCSLSEQPRAPTPPLSQSENHKQYKLPIISMISEDQIHQCKKAVCCCAPAACRESFPCDCSMCLSGCWPCYSHDLLSNKPYTDDRDVCDRCNEDKVDPKMAPEQFCRNSPGHSNCCSSDGSIGLNTCQVDINCHKHNEQSKDYQTREYIELCSSCSLTEPAAAVIAKCPTYAEWESIVDRRENTGQCDQERLEYDNNEPQKDNVSTVEPQDPILANFEILMPALKSRVSQIGPEDNHSRIVQSQETSSHCQSFALQSQVIRAAEETQSSIGLASIVATNLQFFEGSEPISHHRFDTKDFLQAACCIWSNLDTLFCRASAVLNASKKVGYMLSMKKGQVVWLDEINTYRKKMDCERKTIVQLATKISHDIDTFLASAERVDCLRDKLYSQYGGMVVRVLESVLTDDKFSKHPMTGNEIAIVDEPSAERGERNEELENVVINSESSESTNPCMREEMDGISLAEARNGVFLENMAMGVCEEEADDNWMVAFSAQIDLDANMKEMIKKLSELESEVELTDELAIKFIDSFCKILDAIYRLKAIIDEEVVHGNEESSAENDINNAKKFEELKLIKEKQPDENMQTVNDKIDQSDTSGSMEDKHLMLMAQKEDDVSWQCGNTEAAIQRTDETVDKYTLVANAVEKHSLFDTLESEVLALRQELSDEQGLTNQLLAQIDDKMHEVQEMNDLMDNLQRQFNERRKNHLVTQLKNNGSELSNASKQHDHPHTDTTFKHVGQDFKRQAVVKTKHNHSNDIIGIGQRPTKSQHKLTSHRGKVHKEESTHSHFSEERCKKKRTLADHQKQGVNKQPYNSHSMPKKTIKKQDIEHCQGTINSRGSVIAATTNETQKHTNISAATYMKASFAKAMDGSSSNRRSLAQAAFSDNTRMCNSERASSDRHRLSPNPFDRPRNLHSHLPPSNLQYKASTSKRHVSAKDAPIHCITSVNYTIPPCLTNHAKSVDVGFSSQCGNRHSCDCRVYVEHASQQPQQLVCSFDYRMTCLRTPCSLKVNADISGSAQLKEVYQQPNSISGEADLHDQSSRQSTTLFKDFPRIGNDIDSEHDSSMLEAVNISPMKQHGDNYSSRVLNHIEKSQVFKQHAKQRVLQPYEVSSNNLLRHCAADPPVSVSLKQTRCADEQLPLSYEKNKPKQKNKQEVHRLILQHARNDTQHSVTSQTPPHDTLSSKTPNIKPSDALSLIPSHHNAFTPMYDESLNQIVLPTGNSSIYKERDQIFTCDHSMCST